MMEFRHVHTNLQGKPTVEIVYTIKDVGDLKEVMQEFRNFLLAVSYQPGSVDQYIEAE